jgi:hypothetical protein
VSIWVSCDRKVAAARTQVIASLIDRHTYTHMHTHSIGKRLLRELKLLHHCLDTRVPNVFLMCFLIGKRLLRELKLLRHCRGHENFIIITARVPNVHSVFLMCS